jgi:AraC-like DNA-binding protein
MLNAQPTASTLIASALVSSPNRQLFASHDLEETCAMVGRVMKPHQLGISRPTQRLNSRMHHLAFGDVSLSRLKYGAEVDIRPGPLEDFYLVQMPLVGHALIESGHDHVDSGPEVASVLSPTEPTTMRWGADNDQLMVRIARPLMDRALLAQLGRPADEPLRFELGFRWRDCAAWRCLMSYLLECSAQDVDVVRHKFMTSQIEQLVVATLFSMHAHNYSDAQPARRTAILPRHVRKVEEYLQAHAHEPVCADQLAQLAGVSLRSLYAGFKDFCGVSPMQYLKDLRLERARSDLLNLPDVANVASVALRWGFAHLGRFSVDYKERFGESPSESLRRR